MNMVATHTTVVTIWKIVVRVKPLKSATATNGMVTSTPVYLTMGAKNMEISSPAAIVRKSVCILCIIVVLFFVFSGCKNK